MKYFKKQIVDDKYQLEANIFLKSIKDAQDCIKISCVKKQEYDYFWNESKKLVNFHKNLKYIKKDKDVILDDKELKIMPNYKIFCIFNSFKIKYWNDLDKLENMDEFENTLKDRLKNLIN